jgi:hypothetical protein
MVEASIASLKVTLILLLSGASVVRLAGVDDITVGAVVSLFPGEDESPQQPASRAATINEENQATLLEQRLKVFIISSPCPDPAKCGPGDAKFLTIRQLAIEAPECNACLGCAQPVGNRNRHALKQG